MSLTTVAVTGSFEFETDLKETEIMPTDSRNVLKFEAVS